MRHFKLGAFGVLLATSLVLVACDTEGTDPNIDPNNSMPENVVVDESINGMAPGNSVDPCGPSAKRSLKADNGGTIDTPC